MKTIATLINYSCKSFSHFSDVFFLKFATSCVASWHFIWIFVNQNGWFFARFTIMIFAITCISNLIATKFDDKDAYLLILELTVKLVWSSGSCDHMIFLANHRSLSERCFSDFFDLQKPGVLKQSMNKGCLWSPSLQRPQNQLFLPFVSDAVLKPFIY